MKGINEQMAEVAQGTHGRRGADDSEPLCLAQALKAAENWELSLEFFRKALDMIPTASLDDKALFERPILIGIIKCLEGLIVTQPDEQRWPLELIAHIDGPVKSYCVRVKIQLPLDYIEAKADALYALKDYPRPGTGTGSSTSSARRTIPSPGRRSASSSCARWGWERRRPTRRRRSGRPGTSSSPGRRRAAMGGPESRKELVKVARVLQEKLPDPKDKAGLDEFIKKLEEYVDEKVPDAADIGNDARDEEPAPTDE